MARAKIIQQAGILLTGDFPRAKAFWIDVAGFEAVGLWGEPHDFGIFARDGARVMIGRALKGDPPPPIWTIRPGLWNAYFWVDDVCAMFAELNGRGAKIDYDLCEQPYGVLEFGIQDPDGHDIGFGQVVRTP
jgi:hypothetical protein